LLIDGNSSKLADFKNILHTPDRQIAESCFILTSKLLFKSCKTLT